MNTLAKTLLRKDVLFFSLLLALFYALLKYKFNLETYNSLCSPYIPDRAFFCWKTYTPWRFASIPFFAFFGASAFAYSKYARELSGYYGGRYMERWYFRAIYAVAALFVVGVVSSNLGHPIFPSYVSRPYDTWYGVLAVLTCIYAVFALLTSKFAEIGKGILVYQNDGDSVSPKNEEKKLGKSNRQLAVEKMIRGRFPAMLDEAVEYDFARFAPANAQSVPAYKGAIMVTSIDFESETDVFICFELVGKMKSGLAALKGYDWKLKIDSSMALPDFRNAVWRSRDWKNGIVLELEREKIDFSQTFPFPFLYEHSPLLVKPLDVCIWKDEKGVDVTFDLATAPHLLVAGTTGKGKSVGVNNLIVSLLKNVLSGANIDRIYLIDPKVVEFGPYKRLPRVTYCDDLERAVGILEEMVEEMERRYHTLEDASVKNIWEYVAKGFEMGNRIGFVDEFADFVINTNKDLVTRFENSLQRLMQKGRAAGLHVILATQRPSADVIKPIIRSNIPSRLGFWTDNEANSKIILGKDSDALANLPRGEAYLSTSEWLVHVKTYFIPNEDMEGFISFYSSEANAMLASPLSSGHAGPEVASELAAFRRHMEESGSPVANIESPAYVLFSKLVSGRGYASRAEIRLFAKDFGVTNVKMDALIAVFRERDLVVVNTTTKYNDLSPALVTSSPESLVPLYSAIAEVLWT